MYVLDIRLDCSRLEHSDKKKTASEQCPSLGPMYMFVVLAGPGANTSLAWEMSMFMIY